MKKTLASALLGLTIALLGCNSKTPPESLTRDVVMKEASKELLHGMEIEDFRRENGWQDQNAQNRYIVRYEYKIKLTQDMPVMVLEMAKATMQDIEKTNKNPGLMGIEALGTNWGLGLQAARLRKEEGYATRRNAFLGRCPQCLAYLSAGGNQKLAEDRLLAFDASWSYMLHELNFGLEDKHATGATLARTYWVAFMNTEQGWKQAH